MKKLWPLLVLGFGMYALFALTTLPATLITDRLASRGVNMIGVQGTVWKGTAAAVQVSGVNLGELSWNVRLLKLFMGQAGADLAIKLGDGTVNCGVFYGLLSGQISLDDLKAAVPISALPTALTQGGWEGRLQANFSELTIADGWPASAKGSVQALNLVGPLNRPNNLGSFKVSFPATKPVADALTGDLISIDGPLQVTATLQLKAATRGYLITGTIRTEGKAPADIDRTLQFLGEPDAQGNRPFTIEGTL